ncbi:MAG: hypothetical protein U9R74_11995 [Pseudomonadota bacterium]|nr:hypothetical protein [Pseudomonadota bacterium]
MSDTEMEMSLLDAVDRIQLTLERIQGVTTLAGYYAEIEVGDQDLAKAIYLCGGLAKELDEFINDWWDAQRKKDKKHKRRKKRGAVADQNAQDASRGPPLKLHDET